MRERKGWGTNGGKAALLLTAASTGVEVAVLNSAEGTVRKLTKSLLTLPTLPSLYSMTDCLC